MEQDAVKMGQNAEALDVTEGSGMKAAFSVTNDAVSGPGICVASGAGTADEGATNRRCD